MKAPLYLILAASAIPAFAQTPSSPTTEWLGIGDNWALESNWSDGLPSETTSAVFRIQAGETSTIANINGDTYVKDLYFTMDFHSAQRATTSFL